MANNVNLEPQIDAFKNAIYGEDVRDALVAVARAIQSTANNQVIVLENDPLGLSERGKGADAKYVGDHALWVRGKIEADLVNPLGTIDLNDYTDNGIWYVVSATAAVTGLLLNKPEGVTVGGYLIVFHNLSYNPVNQIYFTITGTMYIRGSTSSTGWSSWSRLATTAALSSLSDNVSTLTDNVFKNRGNLDATVNLNDIVDNGVYNIPSNQIAMDAQNVPVALSGKLLVFNPMSSTSSYHLNTLLQMYVSYSGKSLYIRSSSSGVGWGEWKRFATSEMMDEAFEKALTRRDNLSGTNGDDVHALSLPGMYFIDMNDPPANLPSGLTDSRYLRLLVVKHEDASNHYGEWHMLVDRAGSVWTEYSMNGSGTTWSGWISGAGETDLRAFIAPVFGNERLSSSESGLFSLSLRGIYAATGGRYTEGSGQELNTAVSVSITMPTNCIAELNLPEYEWTSWSYNSGNVFLSAATHSNSSKVYRPGTEPIYCVFEEGDRCVRFGFRRADGADLTTQSEDEETNPSDFYKIQHALHIWTPSCDPATLDEMRKTSLRNRGTISLTNGDDVHNLFDAGVYLINFTDVPQNAPPFISDYSTGVVRLLVVKSFTATTSGYHQGEWHMAFAPNGDVWTEYCVDNAGTNWTEWTRLANTTDISDIEEKLNYDIDTSEFSWSFGGLSIGNTTVKSTDAKNRLRLLGADRKGGIPVVSGSKITANNGYKFSVVLYSEYASATDYTMIGKRYMAEGDYTVPEDCYIRVSIGRTDDADLWEEVEVDSEEGTETLKRLTAEGIIATSEALMFELHGDGVINDMLKAIPSEEKVLELPDEIPVNAIAYHKLWDDMVASEFVERIRLADVDNDDEEDLNTEVLPIYLYRIRSYNDVLNRKYLRAKWVNTGTLDDSATPSASPYNPNGVYLIGDFCTTTTNNLTKYWVCIKDTTMPAGQNMDTVNCWREYVFEEPEPYTAGRSYFVGDFCTSADGERLWLCVKDVASAPSVLNSDNWLQYVSRGTPLFKKPKIFLSACIHGNERIPSVVLWDLAKRLTTHPDYQMMRDAFEWYFVPIVNPWGFSHTVFLKKDGHSGNVFPDDYTMKNGKGMYGQYYYDHGPSGANDLLIRANTSDYHTGIRTNKYAYDCNRDFSDTEYSYSTDPKNQDGTNRTYGFQTVEANAIRDALDLITGDGEDPFIFAIDAHLATYSKTVTDTINAFLSLAKWDNGPTDADKSFVYGKWMQAGAKSMMDLADWKDISDGAQTIFPWDGTTANTIRNYLHAYASYAMCYEASQTAAYYTNATKTTIADWGNKTARAVCNTSYQNFIRKLTEHWM